MAARSLVGRLPAPANGRNRRYLAVGAHPDEWSEVHRTRPVPFATREARFGVANRRPLRELNRSRLRFTFVIKAASEPAPTAHRHRSRPEPAREEGRSSRETDASHAAPNVSRLLRSRSRLREGNHIELPTILSRG